MLCQMMLGVKVFGPQAGESEQCCCRIDKVHVSPGELLTCQLWHGASMFHQFFHVFFGHWCQLSPCPFLVLAQLLVTAACHLQPLPCPLFLWSWLGIAAYRAAFLQLTLTGEKLIPWFWITLIAEAPDVLLI